MTRDMLFGAAGLALLVAACEPPSAPADMRTEAPPAPDRGDAAINQARGERLAARNAEPERWTPSPETQTAKAAGPLDGPLSEGAWSYKQMQTGPAALFGEGQTEARFVIRCEASEHRILFEPAGALDEDRQVLMSLTTPAETRRYYVSEADTELPVLRASVRAGDSGLDRLAATDGPIAMSLEGREAVLRMPADPAVGRVIRECRTA